MNDVGFIEEEQTESSTIAHVGDSKKLTQSSVWDDVRIDNVSVTESLLIGSFPILQGQYSKVRIPNATDANVGLILSSS